ncbi:MAG: oligopeptide/dipeptide ABC transporter ATP-binding protein [Phycisphaerales bacterium]
MDCEKKIILSVENLCKYFPIYSKGFFAKISGYVKAVDDVSFDLFEGETIGLVGESGCGKTTAARTILRALTPTSGKIILKTNGISVDLADLSESHLKALRPKMQMIFQDPFSSLNPRMTIGNIVGEPLIIHKMAKKREMLDKVKQILVRVGLSSEHLNRYPHAFSGGQRQRIGIARALIMNPSLIIADEAVSALDVSVQAQVLNLLMDLQKEFNLTYIFVSHNLGVVRYICNRVAVMYAGKIVEIASTEKLFENPLHPYTQMLLSAIPHPDPDIKLVVKQAGEIADITSLPDGCKFYPRCSFRSSDCLCNSMQLKKIDDDHFVACPLKS